MNDLIGADRPESITLGYPEVHDGQRSQHRKQASERFKWSRMQSMMYHSNGGFQSLEPSYAKGEWIVPSGYNYAVPTNVNYAAPPEDRKECFGQYQAVRRTRDFEYHGTYSRERQLFQDSLVNNVVGASSSKEHPWVVFTAGAMGAGKSYTINWMSQMGYFPLPDIVTIDPDLFKTSFPEWPQYLKHRPEAAGSLTRKESGYLVEIAQEIVLSQKKNVWVDGSLRDSQWYEGVFEDIRKKHPTYRIAILYVYARDELVLERARLRGEETGRIVPEEDIRDSLYRVPRTVTSLLPKADFVAHIENEGEQPRLTGFCDWRGCHRNVWGGWKEVKNRFATLPEFSDRCRWTAIVECNISMPGVLVYSKTYCSFCSKLKGLLRQLRIPFRVEELDKMQGGAAMQLALAARPSSRCNTVPQLFAGGEFIGGCSDALVLHAQGKLEPILRKAAAEALPEGEKGLSSPVGRAGSPFEHEESFRPTISRSLSA